VSVLPITAIVLLLCFTISPIPTSTLTAFIVGAALLIVGMGLFTLGAEMAMTPIGEHVGSHMTKSKSLWVVVIVCFIVGVMITISEPDLQVLANQVPSIPNNVLIGAVSVGVGLFLVISLLRILFTIKLKYMLIAFYGVIFILAAVVSVVSPDFLPVAFDSGGVTTGPMTVPFIMALGVGVASIRSDSEAGNDSFGLVALCSIGPILSVLILGLVFRPEESAYVAVQIPEVQNSRELWQLFTHDFPEYFKEVLLALLPIIGFFAVFQIFVLKLKKRPLIRILIGLIYTYLGLALFLTGVNVGFMPAGNYIGNQIGSLGYNYILIPIGMIMGYFIVAAEPAVHVLNKQVEDITSGAIPKRAMSISLSIGVSASVGLAMFRVLTGLPILWFVLVGYVVAIVLSFFVPPIFTSIAFDSGGVASGPMTATFLLPFAMGASEAVGGNIVTDAFGVVAMVAMTPLITIQLMGILYRNKLKPTEEEEASLIDQTEDDTEVIEL
jgi:hypothetical protein